MERNIEVCRDCGGKGEIIHWTGLDKGIVRDCPTCFGTGKTVTGMVMEHERMIPDRVYHIKLEDCCVNGSFVSKFVGWLVHDYSDEGEVYWSDTLPDKDYTYSDAVFTNGITLEGMGIGWGPLAELVEGEDGGKEWVLDPGDRPE